MSDLNRIVLQAETLQQIVEDKAQKTYHTKLSQLINTAGFVTANDTVNHAVTADSTEAITGSSGASAGTYGQPTDVTIGGTESGTVTIPYFTVNAQGIITSVTQRTLNVSTLAVTAPMIRIVDAVSVVIIVDILDAVNHHRI